MKVTPKDFFFFFISKKTPCLSIKGAILWGTCWEVKVFPGFLAHIKPTLHVRHISSAVLWSRAICCCNNWIWNPCRSIIRQGGFKGHRRYRCHLEQSLGSWGLSLYGLCLMLLAANFTTITCTVMLESNQFLRPAFPSIGSWDLGRSLRVDLVSSELHSGPTAFK